MTFFCQKEQRFCLFLLTPNRVLVFLLFHFIICGDWWRQLSYLEWHNRCAIIQCHCYNMSHFMIKPVFEVWDHLGTKLKTQLQRLLLAHTLFKDTKFVGFFFVFWERSGSVVVCLTWDGGAAGSSLTSVTALCPWARHIIPSLVLVQPRKTPFVAERLLMGRKESNQTKKTKLFSQLWMLHKYNSIFVSSQSRFIIYHTNSLCCWKTVQIQISGLQSTILAFNEIDYNKNNIFFVLITLDTVGLQIGLCNWKSVFFLLNQNICCGNSKEQSQWDGSFEHPKRMFKLMGKKIFTILR